jgi:hypothetical protein
MALKTVVDIKRILYAAAMTAGPLTGAAIKAIIGNASTKEVKNVHSTTWAYEEDEPSINDYRNQINNGAVYYRDSEPGSKSVSFSIGQYDYETMAELIGGTATSTSWTASTDQGLVYKTLIAVTKDDTYLVFPKAQIVARRGMIEDKLIGLLVTATPLDTGIDGLESEGWFDASEIA